MAIKVACATGNGLGKDVKLKPTTLFVMLLILLLLHSNVNAANLSIINANDTKILILIDRNVDVVNTPSNATANANNTNLEDTFKTIFSDFGGSLNYIIQNVLSLFFIALLIMFYFWIRRDEDMLIQPFEVARSEDKYNGKAITDLLISEIYRIYKIINKTTYERIENKTEPETFSVVSLVIDREKGIPMLSTPSVMPITSMTTSIPSLGTISMGSATISIGELMLTIKRICRGYDYRQVITGSLQRYGSEISLVACLVGKQCQAWEEAISRESQ